VDTPGIIHIQSIWTTPGAFMDSVDYIWSLHGLHKESTETAYIFNQIIIQGAYQEPYTQIEISARMITDGISSTIQALSCIG
jgi:hypothetical protein